MNFRMDFSISAKKIKRHWDYKGIESIDHFG